MDNTQLTALQVRLEELNARLMEIESGGITRNNQVILPDTTNTWKCSQCDLVSNSREDALNHARNSHQPPKIITTNFKMDICGVNIDLKLEYDQKNDTFILDDFDGDEYVDAFANSLYDELRTNVEKFIEDLPPSIAILNEEFNGRNEIISDCSYEYYKIAYDFDNSPITGDDITCWCCQEVIEMGFGCVNQHSSLLCGNCLVQLMHHSQEKITCGICRSPLAFSRKTIKTNSKPFEDVYPHLKIVDFIASFPLENDIYYHILERWNDFC